MKPELWHIPESSMDEAALLALKATLQDRLAKIVAGHHRCRFATSLAAEDMVLTDAIIKFQRNTAANNANNTDIIELFTLDTGRLPAKTLEMIATVEQHYGIKLRVLAPDDADVAAMVAQYGLDGFYESETAKQQCCHVRKVLPLNRALSGADAWLTGQRRQQSTTRLTLDFEEEDKARNMKKYNPLFDWSETDVWAYLRHEAVPIHPLHLRGYPSIGCDPCTRPVRAGEDIRAGRWWWLLEEKKECGLHVAPQ